MATWTETLGDLVLERNPLEKEMATVMENLEGQRPLSGPGGQAGTQPPADHRDMSIRHSSALRWDTCGLCDARTEPGWRVTKGAKPVCAACEAKYPVLSGWAEQLNRTCPTPTPEKVRWGIVSNGLAANALCGCSSFADKKMFPVERRGDFEIANVDGYIGQERHSCEDCVQRYPTDELRQVLDHHYGHARPLRPPPAPPPGPTAEELAARAKQDRLAAAAKRVGLVLWPGGGRDAYVGERAEHEARVTRTAWALMEAMAAYLKERESQ